MARPIEYNYEILKPKIDEYINECEDSWEKEMIGVDDEGKSTYKITKKVRIPTIEGLALKLGINKTTIYEWESIFPEFSNDISRLRAKQAENLVNKGLSGDYNPTIAKVLLSKHGYREGIENTGKDGKDLIPPTLSEEDKNKLLGLLNDKTGSTESN